MADQFTGRYEVTYVTGYVGPGRYGRRIFAGEEPGYTVVEASDRVAAYAALLSRAEFEKRLVWVAPRDGGLPLGFSSEEMERVREQGLPFIEDVPREDGEAIQIESIEPTG